MANTQVQTESTNLAVAEETSFASKVVPTTGWHNIEPNSYGAFGPSYKKEPRDPISKNAQLRQSMMTDLDSGIAIETDITKDNLDRFAAGCFRCVAKHCGNKQQSLYQVSAVTSTGYTVPANGDIAQNFLIMARGFDNDANNGLKVVGVGSIGTETKTSGLVAETPSNPNATIEIVGYRGTSGDIRLDANGNLTSVTVDFTTWNLTKFQWLSIGDPNNPAVSFATTEYQGAARARSIAAHLITLDRRNWDPHAKSFLDLHTVSTHIDTVVEAQVAGSAGDSITVHTVDDGTPGTHAFLALAGYTTHVNTVIEAIASGVGGNSITVDIVAGAPTAAGVLTETGTHVTLQYKATATATTVAQLETLIGTSSLIRVKTAGTGSTILDGTDTMPSTPLAGGTADAAPTLTESGNAVTIHFVGGGTTVAQIEALIAGSSTLIEVKTPGTGSAVLVHTSDEFAATNLAGGASGADVGAGKTIDVYFSRFYRNVATDHPDYRTPSYVFEVEYPTLNAGAPEFEYLYGNMIDTCEWNIVLTAKATMSLKFVGTKTFNPTTVRKTGPASALNPNTNAGISTATDLSRLRVVDHDELGISTDLMSLKISQSNGISPEKTLGNLGAKYMNIGKHKEMVEMSLVFTSDTVIKAVRDNRPCSLDILMRNADFGALYDIQSMTMDTADRKLERDKGMVIDAKSSGFQDLKSGSTASLSVFAYLPVAVADSDS